MHKWILALAIAFAVSGCETTEELTARMKSQCASYGFQPGTDAMAMCVMQGVSDEREEDREALENISERLQNYGQAPQPTLTTCTPWAGSLSCTSW